MTEAELIYDTRAKLRAIMSANVALTELRLQRAPDSAELRAELVALKQLQARMGPLPQPPGQAD